MVVFDGLLRSFGLIAKYSHGVVLGFLQSHWVGQTTQGIRSRTLMRDYCEPLAVSWNLGPSRLCRSFDAVRSTYKTYVAGCFS